MRVLYFGIYSTDPVYPRNNNLIRGLRKNGVEVVEIHFNMVGTHRKRMDSVKNPFWSAVFLMSLCISYLALAIQFLKCPQADALIVGHPGYFHVHFARILCGLLRRRMPIVYDVFIPLYDALAEDRGLLDPQGFMARILHRFEASCCRSADTCLVDTLAHSDYLTREFGISSEKVAPVLVGPTIRETYLFPRPRGSGSPFRVLYVGTYIPLHGVEVILGAARILLEEEDIQFLLVGSGQERDEMEHLARAWALSNVRFKDWVPTEDLGDLIRSYDLALGIFGSTPKASRVIPSKVFDICAAGAPVITADTPAIRWAFTHLENAYLVPPGDPGSLADAICRLRRDEPLREKIKEGAFQTGRKVFSLQHIGEDLLRAISSV